ncbi:NADH-quinone oxidoreductase subunit M [Inquilinus limosus]|uniref:NADH-quinone oxidoreductase chain 13 n=1 Tax=Inquilinus limosus MP06 TaxID=1398085 RepID=A0A0A0DBF6_9PROT|nr:NADH-quinone oxidoreductase subunit M [Inquilinus limosus]KGM35424.1 NADH-quinone oxidoreductase chain 13 [Inquilinus limosus MP06]
MGNWPILSLATFLPLVGAALILLLARGSEAAVAATSRWVALWTTLVTFALTVAIWLGFDPSVVGFQMEEKVAWFPDLNIAYHMGVDGISVLFVVLSAFLMPICILASWESIHSRVKEYMVSFLILETMMIGMFCALDYVLFYVFFEGVLIPMFVIIGIWGSGERRIYAAFKLFLFTLLGSVLMLVALLAMYVQAGTTDIPTLLATDFGYDMQVWLWLAMFASFAVKVPMWPVHTWLPDAHVEAPTAGSVILAGVLLKMGGYGFLRFSIPMLPEATALLTPLVYGLSIVAVIYTSLVALAQEDMKKMIAYSSIAHMGFVTAGMFSLTQQGVEGSIFQMLSHGVVSSALFLCVGVVYDRLHTREIARYGGLATNMPKYAVFFMIMLLGSVGLPATSGFVGEFMIMLGLFQVNTWVATLVATGLILGATYMLLLYRKVIFGEITRDDVRKMTDLSPREICLFVPLAIVVLWMGIYPSSFLNVMSVSVDHLVTQYHADLGRADAVAVAVR